MEIDKFENLVYEAVEQLPEFFKSKLENVDVVIDEWPHERLAKGSLLLGLYQGVPQTKRDSGYTMALPDKITIFKGPIELVSQGDKERTKSVVRDTVKHEIAHHFGISDERLKQVNKKSEV